MQIFKRVTAMCMVLIMMLSAMSLSLIASAVEINVSTDKLLNNQTTGIWQGSVTDNGNANDTNATVLLDFLDEVLAELNIKKELDLKVTKIAIDATSVNSLLGTLDLVKSVSGLVNGFGSLKKLNCRNWTSGQTRQKTADETILKNLIKFLYDNRELIQTIVDGSFTCANGGFLDIGATVNEVLGIDPANGKTILWRIDALKDANGNAYAYLSDWLKDTLANWAGTPEYAKSTLDTIIYMGIVGKKLQSVVPGFTMNAGTTTEQLILSLVNSVWNTYAGGLIGKVNEYKEGFGSNAYTKPIAGLVNFDVKAEDVKINLNTIADVNNALGAVLVKVFPAYTGWKNGTDLALVSGNLVNALAWVLANADTAVMTEEVAAKYAAWNEAAVKDVNTSLLSLVKLVVNAGWPNSAYSAIADAQTTVEGALVSLLKQIIADNKSLAFAVIGAKSTTAEAFLGDFAGSFLAQYIPLYTDANNTKRYVAGSGTSVYDVANYALNYFLVDLNIDALLGLNMSKSQNLFAKLDALQAMLFGSIGYEKASKFIPTLVENVLTLDIGGIFTDNVKPIIDEYKSLKACNFVYTILNNVTKSIFGTQLFASATFTSFEAILKSGSKTDDNLGKVVANLLAGIEGRKTQLLPLVYYIYNTLLEDAVITVSGSVKDVNLASSTAQNVTVKYGKYTLKEGTDYKVVYANGGKVGTTKVLVQGIGNYAGAYELGTVKVDCSHKYGNWVTTKAATCTANGSKKQTCSACGDVKTVTITKLGHNIVKDKAVSATYGKAGKTEGSHCSRCNAVIVAQKTVAKKTVGKVTGLKDKSIKVDKSSQITLTWSKVSGADKYEVYIKNGSKWVKLTTTTKTSYTVKKDGKKKALKAGKSYEFRVRAVVEESKKTYTGSYSDVLKVKVAPKAPTLTLKAGKKQLTASWKSISGASGYEVQYSTSSKMKKAKTVKVKKSSKKTTVKKLKKGKKYYARVRTYKTVNGKKIYSDWSKVKNVKVK
ncbi:MAG: hypothetical protein E7558_05115 [Ruminococcaceae bacterium]|nr:hypothetical protein [Oscillospiraceae bacterium]